MNCCYIVRRNSITSDNLIDFESHLQHFYQTRPVFVEEGVRTSISLPRQHAILHYTMGIERFGAPNGLCSSITESLHIRAIKDPWRRSSKHNAICQMLQTVSRTDKLEAKRRSLQNQGYLMGSTSSYIISTPTSGDHCTQDMSASSLTQPVDQSDSEISENNSGLDCGPVGGDVTRTPNLSSIRLATKRRK